ncbi:MAG: U32 family peptidase [Clostridia bacterium]|nr:U32 family peptidase [Clostridia bacterium]
MCINAEILAPAGSEQALRAAVLCGADAVYLGVEELNARRSAENFTADNLKTAVDFCHSRGVKVYLTLNTLVGDSEISTAYNIIKCACAAGIDALILQDLLIVDIVKKAAPDMPLHASTQMSVQTLEGIKLLSSLGFRRAVIPRELNKKEIEYLCKNSPIELEMFVHGALCMCVSGQCYMSAMLGSRSGNRGACAQPCRLPFSANGSGSCDLSLKDLSLTDYLRELKDAGIASFKIEGRMKRPEYVAAAVKTCRNALEGKNDFQLKEDLKSVFSRTGFTDGYYLDNLGKDMFGTRRKEDVVSAAPVLSRLARIYEKEAPRFAVDFEFCAKKGQSVSLSASCGEQSVRVENDFIAQNALNKPLTPESVVQQLGKTGGTQFYAGSVKCDIDDGVNVPVSVINSLRRDALAAVEEKMCEGAQKKCGEYSPSVSLIKQEKTNIICRFANEEQIPENLSDVSEIILPVNAIKTRFDCSAEIPRGIFGSDKIISEKLTEIKSRGVNSVWAGTLDGMALAKNAGFEFSAGFGSNIFNSQAIEAYKELGAKKALLSAEMTLSQIKSLKAPIPTGVFAYGRVPLMLTRSCPGKNKKSCVQCARSGSLTDRKGLTFPVVCSGGCSEILNSKPVYMADKISEIKNVSFLLLYFTTETKEEAAEISEAYRTGKAPSGDFTRGLFYRGVE